MTTAPTSPGLATTDLGTTDLAAARARNESTWRAAAVALYAGDIDGFLDHWVEVPRYSVAYPVEGVPSTVEGRASFLDLFGGFGAATQSIGVKDVRFHQTDDPEVAFVEEQMVAELHDGSAYENQLVLRVTFDEGRISAIHEYYGEVAHRDLIARLSGSAS